MIICTHLMHMYSLVLMIFSFTLVLPIFFFASCICYVFLKLINIHVYPWVTCFHANTIMDSFYIWDMYAYCWFWIKTYICLEGYFWWKINFYKFHICLMKNEFSCFSHDWCFWASLSIFMNMLFTWCLYTHITSLFIHDFVSWTLLWAL